MGRRYHQSRSHVYDLCCGAAGLNKKNTVGNGIIIGNKTKSAKPAAVLNSLFKRSLGGQIDNGKLMTANTTGRPLTRGEIAMASLIFHDAVDYAAVRIHGRPYLWFGLQPRNTAMAPNGQIYFHRSRYLADFSEAGPTIRRWFIHEMVHVWQYQLAYRVKLRGALRIGLPYDYVLSPGRRLADYNMEAQGELLADYFMLKYGGPGLAISQPQYANNIALFEMVLADFLGDRRHAGNLPALIWLDKFCRIRRRRRNDAAAPASSRQISRRR